MSQEPEANFSSPNNGGRNFAPKSELDFSASNSAGADFAQKTGINFSPSSSAGADFAPKTGINFSSPSSPGRSCAPPTGYNNDSRSHQVMQQQQQLDQLQQHSLQLHPQMPYPMYPSLPMLTYGPLEGLSAPALAKAISSFSAERNRTSRSKKKTTPEDKKDTTYFERRRRNNEAAKKSRDSRKTREDVLAGSATELQEKQATMIPELLALQKENRRLKSLWVLKCQKSAIKYHMQMTLHQQQSKVQNSSQDTRPNSDGQGKA